MCATPYAHVKASAVAAGCYLVTYVQVSYCSSKSECYPFPHCYPFPSQGQPVRLGARISKCWLRLLEGERMDPAIVPMHELPWILSVGSNTLPITASLVQQTQVAAYIVFSALSAVTWDCLLAMAEECRIVQRYGWSVAVLAYFVARISTGILCVLSLIFYLPANFTAMGIMMTVGSAAKSYMFLLRLRAVYGNSKLVKLFVGVGWLAVVGTRMTIAFMISTSPVGQAGYCTITNTALPPVLSMWVNVAYDTCIFVAISARITSYRAFTAKAWTSYFFRGHGLPLAMRHLLQEGRHYYVFVSFPITTMCGFNVKIFSTTVIFALSSAILGVAMAPVSPVFQAVWAVPAFGIETNMTCKVFRKMALRSVGGAQNRSAAPVEAWTTGGLSVVEIETFELQTQTTDIELGSVCQNSTSSNYECSCRFYANELRVYPNSPNQHSILYMTKDAALYLGGKYLGGKFSEAVQVEGPGGRNTQWL
ncbi:hypothetical protein FIBSPDRAFT_937898 [Athelia psychrophila]|uniref:DUF6533 domain-containing protein n=1 Tax=Athelia psychrophila TaxID=1759441 RepID=A0A165ZJW5_9AGAM|nr:hypothetical protein FIBSPDRAFT_937898 [Fibularhizoctonia sp. CBS 109695]